MNASAVLLTYYPAYLERAVDEFVRFVDDVCGECPVVIVCNGEARPQTQSDRVHAIEGDNRLREFSGWDAGLAYCREKGWLAEDGLVIFANDTFCHHNRFGPVTRYAFRRAMARASRRSREKLLVGEVWPFGGEYELKGLRASKWVSTYLFAVTAPLLGALGTLSPPFDLEPFFESSEDRRLLGGELSENLRRHVERWLTGAGATKWYGAGPLTAVSRASMTAKARSILCEKYLSAASGQVGGEMLPVFDSQLIVQLRRLEKYL